MSTHLIRTPLRALLAGTVLAACAVVLAVVGEALGVPEPWPVLLVAGAGLLVGVPRLRHGLALAVGATNGLVTGWLAGAVLPDATVGLALTTGIAVLVVTILTVVTSGRLRFGLQLVGWAAMTALAPAAGSTAGLARSYVSLLVAAGLGLLVAQVAQLLAIGVSGRSIRAAAPAVALVLLVTALAGAPVTALAESSDGPSLQHEQVVIRTHRPDGTPVRGIVVTRLVASGAGDLRVALRDQAVTRLRSLSELDAPTAVAAAVTYDLADGRSVRTVADLDRALPVSIEVTYRLDGEPIPPSALVGRSGRLDVTYTVVNRTAEARELRFFDARGRARSVTRDVAVPFVGTLAVSLDDRFTAVRSDSGRTESGRAAGSVLRAELLLFAPVGAPVQSVTWSAQVRDAVVPAVEVRLVPVLTTDVAVGRTESARVEAAAAVLRGLADSGALLRTGLSALGATAASAAPGDAAGDAQLLAQAGAILDGLLDTANVASAEAGEVRALLAAQDQRVRDGDGLTYGLVADEDLPAGVQVESGVVYVLEVAGLGGDGGPSLPLRSVLALVLLVAVGLLGRAVGALTGTDET